MSRVIFRYHDIIKIAFCDEFQVGGILPVLSIIVYAAFFMMSWGPICWVLIAEIFPNTIRGKAVAIAVAFQWIFNYLVSSTFPAMYEFSPVFAYGLYGVICVLAALFVWKMVPETKGKTLEDMTRLWENQIDPSIVFGIPEVACMDMRGQYAENHQLSPDIEVYNTPEKALAGEDQQLEAAVQEMLKTIGEKK